MTVKRLLETVDADEMAYWLAYDSVSPIGDDRADIRTALVCQTIGNRTGGKGHDDPFKLMDYMPDIWGTMKRDTTDDGYPTPEELLIKAKFINSMVCEINQAKQMRMEQDAKR